MYVYEYMIIISIIRLHDLYMYVYVHISCEYH